MIAAFCLAIAASALWVGAGCAPLQRPADPNANAAGGAEGGPPPPRALDTYLQERDESPDDPARYRPWLAVFPFMDDSGFKKDVWELRHEVPRMLSGEMARSPAWRIVPYAAVVEAVGRPPRRWDDEGLAQIGAGLRADLIATGVLLDYNMERLHVGDPLVGGYKSYKGVAEMEVQLIRVADLTRMGTASSQQETVDRGLGLDLLGKPREQDYQFLNLAQMEYGSEEFRATAIGQATVLAMDELVQKLSHLVRPQGIQVTSGAAEILSVFGDEIFVNVGSENGVHEGYRFAVYATRQGAAGAAVGARVGVVEVVDIIGARVSKVTTLSGAGMIGVGDRLELIAGEPEAPREGGDRR